MTAEQIDNDQPFTVGDWLASPVTGELARGENRQRLEPQVMRLLCLLAHRAPGVISRDELLDRLWPDTVVGEDALARCLLKLRRALGDDARAPRYVETLPRRGYRLVAPVATKDERLESSSAPTQTPRVRVRRKAAAGALAGVVLSMLAVLVAALVLDPRSSEESPLLSRAHDHYYRFTRTDNERAHLLYQRVLDASPDDAEARAGMANTLVQRLIRWPEVGGPVPAEEHSVTAALASGRLDTPWARATMDRARLLTGEAVRDAPGSGFTWKAHGLVAALRNDLDSARESYRHALEVDPSNWEAALNLGELLRIAGDDAGAVEQFVRAYRIMERHYAESAQRVGPWQPDVGVMIGAAYRKLGAHDDAESWFRQVLEHTPLHVEATLALAASRSDAGDTDEAAELCRDLVSRIGPLEDCRPYLPDR